jgi:hypothetical protein
MLDGRFFVSRDDNRESEALNWMYIYDLDEMFRMSTVNASSFEVSTVNITFVQLDFSVKLE